MRYIYDSQTKSKIPTAGMMNPNIIAPLEPTTVSKRSYLVGDQLIWNDELYTVTQAISVNDALAVGTNITASDSIVEQIAENTSDITSLNEALTNEETARATLGAHNLLPNNAVSEVKNGITFTVNSDGSFTVNTGPSGATATTIKRVSEDFDLPNGDYVVSGCPSGGSLATYYLFAASFTSDSIIDVGEGASFTISSNSGYAAIVIKAGTVLTTPITFYPMIRLATDLDQTYTPYAMTNRELTKESEVIDNSANLVIDTTNFNITGLSDKNTLFKVGNIVEVNIVGHCKSSATNTTILLATIPEGYRPRSFPSISSYVNGAVSIGIDKYTGTLTIYSAQSQENWVIRAHFTYVCQ